MSRRIRTIKPEILDDDKTAGLSHIAWRLFVSALSLSDDHGNLRAGTTFLSGQVFHSSPDTDPDAVRKAVDELIEASLWQVYTVRGQTYAHIRGWTKHQRIDNAGKPRVPGPNEADGTHPASAEAKNKVRGESRRVAASRGESPRVAAVRGGSRLDPDRDRDQGEDQDQDRESAGASAHTPARMCMHEAPPTSPTPAVLATVVSTEPPPSRQPPPPVEVAPSLPTPASAPSCPVAAPLAASDAEDDDQPPPAQRVPSTPHPGASAAVAPAAPVEAAPAVTPAPPVAAPSAPVAASPSGQTVLLGDEPRGEPSDRASEAVRQVFDHWVARVWNSKVKPKLSDQRVKRIRARLRDGFSVADLCKAIDGATHDDWLMGRKVGARPDGYRDVDTVLRDVAQVERLMALATRCDPKHAPPPPPPPAPRIPAHVKAAVDAMTPEHKRLTALLYTRHGRRPTAEEVAMLETMSPEDVFRRAPAVVQEEACA